MGKPNQHAPVKLIIGLIGQEDIFAEIIEMLVKKFGRFDFESQVINFDFTNYYEPEMGPNLKRKFISFSKNFFPQMLPDIKLYTNSIEKKFSNSQGQRKINIDPGYLTLSKLVLATTKDYQHRIYLAKGIFAEVTLRYRNKTFTVWEWTYPDYKSQGYVKIFNAMRQNLIKKQGLNVE